MLVNALLRRCPRRLTDSPRLLRRVAFLLAVLSGLTCGAPIEAEEGLWDKLHSILERDLTAGEAEVAEKACLALAERLPSPREKGRVFAQLALYYGETGRENELALWEFKTTSYCRMALRYPIHVDLACKLYTLWGDTLGISGSFGETERWAACRRAAAVRYLQGLKLALSVLARGQEPQDLAKAPVSLDRQSWGLMLSWYYIEGDLRKQREVFIGRLTHMYSLEPDLTNEAGKLAQEVLGDSDAVGEIVLRARAEQKRSAEVRAELLRDGFPDTEFRLFIPRASYENPAAIVQIPEEDIGLRPRTNLGPYWLAIVLTCSAVTLVVGMALGLILGRRRARADGPGLESGERGACS